jgi:hypothetical protein
MHDLILPLGFHDIPDVFGEWLSEMAPWAWFATMSFREVPLTNITKAPKKIRTLDSGMALKTAKNSRLAPRLSDKSGDNLRESDMVYEHGTTYTKPGWAYAKKAWLELLKASAPPIDDRKWVRVFEMKKYRGVPHIHALLTASEGSPRRMDMVDWGWRKYGSTRVLEYDPKLGAAHYLGKYLLKDYGKARDNFDIEWGGF